MILNSNYDVASGQAEFDKEVADAIAFGRPDLPRRIRDIISLAKDHAETWYSQGPEGYVDYPRAA